MPRPATAATVSVVPGTVVDILSSNESSASARLTPATLTLQSNPPTGVSQASANATIVVTQPVTLNFTFSDTTVRPIGIAFKSNRTNMPSGTGTGNLNLPFADVSLLPASGNVGPVIQVGDQHIRAPGDQSAKYSWEYYIVFQTATGAIGVIDPDIENDY